MKKLFTFFAAALFATGMSAQEVVYLDNILANGDLEGEGTANFYSKVTPDNVGDPAEAEILDGEGVDGSRGIKIETTGKECHDWDSQFWIVFDENLEQGTEWLVSFDCKADAEISIGTQAHAEPGNYNHWAAAGTVNFKTDWTHYEYLMTVDASMVAGDKGFRSIAFNLTPGTSNTDGSPSDNPVRVFWFDNLSVQQAIVPDPVWLNVIPNGTCEGDMEAGILDDSGEAPLYSFFGNAPEGCIKSLEDGAGFEGTRGYVLESSAEAAQDWDTQFFIVTNHQFEVGERVKVRFDCRADLEDLGLESVTVGTQAHALPGDYIHWACAGNVTFTNDWTEWESEFKTTGDMTKPDDDRYMQSIAFNMNPNINGAKQNIKFYFDNIELYIDEPNATWADMEMNEKVLTGITNVKTVDASKGMYNLAGQKVDNNYKGIVIENGQKRINK